MATLDSSPSAPAWAPKVAAKRKSCDDAIPSDWKLPQSIWNSLTTPLETNKNNLIELDIPRRSGILTEKEIKITESYTVAELLAALSSGELSALEVTIAFSKRAAIAQQLTQCLTETMFDQAQERARYLDSLKAEGRVAGPLHGLPISIKDSFQVAGTQATLGLISFIDHRSEVNSPLVDVLLGLGAVLYADIEKCLDSQNHVFGRTLNPWNTALTPGGSSGGEGALVGFRGSPLGIGTDVGGSIRVPAACNGIYGFKPTASRIPYGGQKSCHNPGFKPILASAGPLAHDLDALETLARLVLDSRPADLDATTLDLPWRRVGDLGTSKLRFGLLGEHPICPLHPPVKRALAETAQVLKEGGHEIVSLETDEILSEAVKACFQLFSLDNTAASILQAGGEPPVPSLAYIVKETSMLDWSDFADIEKLEGLQKFSALNVRRQVVTEQWNEIWTKHKLDAVIAPPLRTTAVEHDTTGVPPYTVFLNLLDYPACVLPVGSVTKADALEPYDPKPGQLAVPYNAELLEGAPSAIQLFTRKMRDEECLAIAKVVDNCLRKVRP